MASRMETRALIEGALLTAITILFSVLDAYVPVFALVYSIPVVILVVRRGFRVGLLATLIAILGTSALTGPLQGVLVLVKVGVVGLTLGSCFRRRISPLAVIMITSLAVLVDLAVVFTISMRISNMNLATFVNAFESGAKRVVDFYTKMGIGGKDLERVKSYAGQMVSALKTLFPAIAVLTVILTAGVNYFLARMVLRKLGHPVGGDIPPFSRWRVSWHWSWGYILGGVILFAGQAYQKHLLTLAGMNLVALFSYLFLVQGLAVGWYFMEKYRMSKLIGVVLAFFAVTNQFLSQILVWVGLFDGWFDFRKFRRVT